MKDKFVSNEELILSKVEMEEKVKKMGREN